MNGVPGFRMRKVDRHASSGVRRINLQGAGIDGKGIESFNRLAAQLVAADAAQDGCVVAKPASHHREICRRATQRSLPARGIDSPWRGARWHVPQ